MRLMIRALGTLIAAGVLTVSLPLGSRAATGQFTYHRFDGTNDTLKTIENPKDGVCFTVFRSRVPVANKTGSHARLLNGRACQGDEVEKVAPGETLGKSDYEFSSVLFSRE
ncbi:hypothetical protein WEB32_30170 [Streptomyces netropsis]|uniref:Secreted protein n=1 Tax=Streptomyces netropsis TaxID=55404 RepID=A0A7W7L7Y2_STRNE|nr:hypothetical protein [Streptomyces netropsis]MBB4885119.1 hypothetical protein [Streptomyces netropsis]GGR26918.1 hypothetical protein GCM10010219_34670 [Streptomyces netropsis]